MRPAPETIDHVRKAVLEIKDFYDRCNCTSNNRISLNISMLSYALGLRQTAEVYPILRVLEQQGYLITADDDCVVFANQFLRASA